jgi:hypothetical protein
MNSDLGAGIVDLLRPVAVKAQALDPNRLGARLPEERADARTRGMADVPSGLSAFLWRDGTTIDLSALLPEDTLSYVFRINDWGQVLGATWRRTDGVSTADLVLWNTRGRD